MPRSPSPPRRRRSRSPDTRSAPGPSSSASRMQGSRHPYSSSSSAAASRRFDPRDDDHHRDEAYRGMPSSRDRPHRDRDQVKNFDGDRDRQRSGYGARERESERKADRQRYDRDADRDARGSNSPPPRPKSPPKPNFKPSGLLARETNLVTAPRSGPGSGTPGQAAGSTGATAGTGVTGGVVLKYNEPPEARKPTRNWRLYVFKGSEQVDLIHIYRQSAYLIGRDRIVADIPISHPSCSKQHAVIQYRQMTERNEFGDTTTSVKPFVIDLESTNGTFVNDQEIPPSRYYELRTRDILKFGQSTREYVLLPEEGDE